MTKPTFDSIASAKAKLAAELRLLDEQEEALRKEQAADAFAKITRMLEQFGPAFDSRQRAEIAGYVVSGVRTVRKSSVLKSEVQPKYWLPHSGETWSGRGRPPKAFTAWEGTVAHREWKASHPNEKWPKYPG
jgi:DNA-binding protein H-NS